MNVEEAAHSTDIEFNHAKSDRKKIFCLVHS